MKTGIQASVLDKKGYGRWGDNTYKKLKEHGFTCSYYDMMNTDTVLYTAPQEEVKRILLHEKALAEEAGIEIDQVHGPWQWPINDGTEEARAERMEKMKKSIEMTSILGCKNWVIHPIMPFTTKDMEKAEETWKLNLEFMSELLKTAKEYDVTICLENMPMLGFSLATPERILEFVKTINDDNFKICLDTGHVNVFKDLNLADEIRRLGDYVRVLHIHDNRFGMDLHLIPYGGSADWDDFSCALRDIGFEGNLTLETIPPRVLDDEIFEDMCRAYAKVAKKLSE